MKELLGYKLMLAFKRTFPPSRILELLAKRNVGGSSLFRALNVGNPGQVRELTDKLQSVVSPNHPPLVLAAEQEGGQLVASGEGTTQFLTNMTLAATRDPELACHVGLTMGTEMAAMGVNFSDAPNVDINTYPDNPASGIRTFGNDPAVAAQMSGEMVSGRLPVTIQNTYDFGHGLSQEIFLRR